MSKAGRASSLESSELGLFYPGCDSLHSNSSYPLTHSFVHSLVGMLTMGEAEVTAGPGSDSSQLLVLTHSCLPPALLLNTGFMAPRASTCLLVS